MLRIADRQIATPVFLAPMAGITDLPFRTVVAGFGAGLVVSEMVASQEMVQAKPSARGKAELGFGIENTSVQLAGCDAHWMAEAARVVADQGARIIDINMGCPAKKVVSAAGAGASGSALMRDIDHALRLIEAVVGAVDVPVTLKTRLGWDEGCLNAAELAKRAEAAGVAMITVHGRTRCQFYRGAADWAMISDIVQAVNIPVIANGDIVGVATARRAMAQSNAAGVMIGRGARGRPWLLAEVAAAMGHGTAPEVPRGAALADLVAGHYEAMLGFYGRDLGLRVARKHLGWYMEAAGSEPEMRRAVLTADQASVVLGLLPEAMAAEPAAQSEDCASRAAA
ncbi:MAG: tRNA-dihydrouridine synthase [Roseovarius sp. BRH_c41]|uniref:tRNA dihydrouridine synthase DusB n=1 Tax=Roseovarius sp. BRH_c41 TaxID=1629709 RepID=UPI0005F1EF4F|nr:tRNA dihydrouridine synthase DusB [Roseovarius sp. BRH_c41]KJS42099.1 MAG: tRNA-dihydrouridine synthase [Roseovarius sp. BRH_c41]